MSTDARTSRHRRETLLDAAAVAAGVALVLTVATAVNRLPYPGGQPYAHRVVIPAVRESGPALDFPPTLEPSTEYWADDVSP